MRWLKWTMIAVAGAMPAVGFGREPSEGDSRHLRMITVRVLPSEDEGQTRFVLGEPGPEEHQEHRAKLGVQLQSLMNSVKREKGSYLGVSASAPPQVLRKQLGLSGGMGLVADFVVPESPAAKAGLQQYDVLQKFDDQLLINPDQLAVLVRSKKPGDEVKLSIIRDGKPTTLTAKLAEHEMEPLGEGAIGERPWNPWGMPDAHARAIVLGEHRPAQNWQINPAAGVAASSITWLDGDRSYTIATDNERHKIYTVKDRDGKSIFTGPIDTAEQRAKLDAELKGKLEKMERSIPGATVTEPAGGGFRVPKLEKHKAKESDEK